jgi:hypothetical protein
MDLSTASENVFTAACIFDKMQANRWHLAHHGEAGAAAVFFWLGIP